MLSLVQAPIVVLGAVGAVTTLGIAFVGSTSVAVDVGSVTCWGVGATVGVASSVLFPPNMFKMLAPATTMMIIGMTHCRSELVLRRGVATGGRLVAGVCGSGGMLVAGAVAGLAEGAVCGTDVGRLGVAGVGVGRLGVDDGGVSGTCNPVVWLIGAVLVRVRLPTL